MERLDLNVLQGKQQLKLVLALCSVLVLLSEKLLGGISVHEPADWLQLDCHAVLLVGMVVAWCALFHGITLNLLCDCALNSLSSDAFR